MTQWIKPKCLANAIHYPFQMRQSQFSNCSSAEGSLFWPVSGTGQCGVIKMQVYVGWSSWWGVGVGKKEKIYSSQKKKKGEGWGHCSRKYFFPFLWISFYYVVVISVYTRYKIIVLKVLITMHMKLFKCIRRFFDQLKEGSILGSRLSVELTTSTFQ